MDEKEFQRQLRLVRREADETVTPQAVHELLCFDYPVLSVRELETLKRTLDIAVVCLADPQTAAKKLATHPLGPSFLSRRFVQGVLYCTTPAAKGSAPAAAPKHEEESGQATFLRDLDTSVAAAEDGKRAATSPSAAAAAAPGDTTVDADGVKTETLPSATESAAAAASAAIAHEEEERAQPAPTDLLTKINISLFLKPLRFLLALDLPVLDTFLLNYALERAQNAAAAEPAVTVDSDAELEPDDIDAADEDPDDFAFEDMDAAPHKPIVAKPTANASAAPAPRVPSWDEVAEKLGDWINTCADYSHFAHAFQAEGLTDEVVAIIKVLLRHERADMRFHASTFLYMLRDRVLADSSLAGDTLARCFAVLNVRNSADPSPTEDSDERDALALAVLGGVVTAPATGSAKLALADALAVYLPFLSRRVELTASRPDIHAHGLIYELETCCHVLDFVVLNASPRNTTGLVESNLPAALMQLYCQHGAERKLASFRHFVLTACARLPGLCTQFALVADVWRGALAMAGECPGHAVAFSFVLAQSERSERATKQAAEALKLFNDFAQRTTLPRGPELMAALDVLVEILAGLTSLFARVGRPMFAAAHLSPFMKTMRQLRQSLLPLTKAAETPAAAEGAEAPAPGSRAEAVQEKTSAVLTSRVARAIELLKGMMDDATGKQD